MSAYRCGSFDKIREFIKLRERLSSSLHYSSVSVEKKLSDLALTTGLLTLTVDFSKVSNFFRGNALSAHAVFSFQFCLFYPSSPFSKHDFRVTTAICYARIWGTVLGSFISLRVALGCYCEQTWATCHIESHASAVQMTELFEVDPVKDYTLTTELSDNRDFRPVASWEHAER